MMNRAHDRLMRRVTAAAVFSVFGVGAYSTALGATFSLGEDESIKGSWVTSITGATAIRTKNPSCALTGDPNQYGCGSSANTAQWSNGDDGDLNYKKGQAFARYLNLTSEILLSSEDTGAKFFIRGTGTVDFAADKTQRTELSEGAKRQIVRNKEMLDLWGEKSFDLFGRSARVRIGQQALNWGESYFAFGGINGTNALDFQKLSTPGTQVKQALLPSPMLNVATSVGRGVSMEGYWQWKWRANRYSPVGSYWSASDSFGRGAQPIAGSGENYNVSGLDAGSIAGPGWVSQDVLSSTNQNLIDGVYSGLPTSPYGVVYDTVNARDRGQFGLRFGYTPEGSELHLGFYLARYNDKTPVLDYQADGTGRWRYLDSRTLFGVSASMPAGEWAVGTELSYRPRDPVAVSGCFVEGGPSDYNVNGVSGQYCPGWRENKRLQWILNGQRTYVKSQSALVRLLGADVAYVTAELSAIYYPGVKSNKAYTRTLEDGTLAYQLPSAGYITWLRDDPSAGYPITAGKGTALSMGGTVDLNVTYDGSVVPGWQLTPGVTLSSTLYGVTPNYSYNYASRTGYAYFYVLLNQNPTTWSLGLNYATFFGNAQKQIYKDRDFVGLYVTRNF